MNYFFVLILISQENGCFKKGCHDLLLEERIVHPPAEDCETCHTKTKKHSFEKIKNVFSLCTTCHSDKEESTHPPALDNCAQCHNPHSSPIEKLLRERLPYLCEECHTEITKGKLSVHQPVKDGKCNSCHNVHGNEEAFFLLKKENRLCFSCHRNMGEKIKNAKFIHPPVEDCKNCHLVHSSDFPHLLNSMYPRGIYNFYSRLQYEICFNCHSEDIVGNQTGFKKNGKNLHSVHLKRTRGRICTLCHSPHSSNNPKLVEGGKPFGPNNYILKIDFKKKKGGGICGPSCHGKVEY